MSKAGYNILVIDDEPEFHTDLKVALGRSFIFEGVLDAVGMYNKLSSFGNYDLILLDLALDGKDPSIGLDLIPDLIKRFPDIPIIVVSMESKVDIVVEALKRGAIDYLPKKELDFDLWYEKFNTTIEAKNLTKDKNRNKNRSVAIPEQPQTYPFIGESAQIKEIKRMLKKLSDSPHLPVLITGETGVGKEVAAVYLYRESVRRNGPFFAVNLSAISKSMLDSELFGHKKGSFINAEFDREGYFRQANGGVLLLDEIGDISADIQIKLLRLLETRHIRPLGWDRDVPFDIHILAATHRNLPEAVKKEKFRADLYHRLNVSEVYIPPLRERLEDIPLIIHHYFSQSKQHISIISATVMDLFFKYQWPGNIRELVSTIQSMLIKRSIYNQEKIGLECLPKSIQDFASDKKDI
ncbi:MAG: sigma-54 dependent transcriptional regulator [Saprospiraceae bacterium]|nr:sigma-54 dependent transcriptional regulator [Saprospiraceae bacterium]